MSVIPDTEIAELVNLFNRRGVMFYHACQYKDFKTYIRLGGVPSRNLMESSELPYTVFEKDGVDKTNEIWDKVFGNLSDFGFSFAKGKRNENTAPTPNPYGPILLIFKPEVFYEAIDVAICLRSAGGRDFNRDAESLSSVDEIDRVFRYSIEEAPNDYAKADIKFSVDLREEFNDSQAMSPEVSCTVEDERISFGPFLDRIIVDAYIISGQSLTEKVKNLKQANSLTGVVWERRYSEGRREIKQELADLLLEKIVTVDEIVQSEQTSQDLKDWASRVIRGKMRWQYDRFIQYLRVGTILELNDEAS
jgi:hypothetical protein